jgi:hypothetical protein
VNISITPRSNGIMRILKRLENPNHPIGGIVRAELEIIQPSHLLGDTNFFIN